MNISNIQATGACIEFVSVNISNIQATGACIEFVSVILAIFKLLVLALSLLV